jgi:hypothetical protein
MEFRFKKLKHFGTETGRQTPRITAWQGLIYSEKSNVDKLRGFNTHASLTKEVNCAGALRILLCNGQFSFVMYANT